MTSTPGPARGIERLIAGSERPGRGPRPLDTADLSSGDPDFPTPPHIRQALTDAAAAGYSNYPPSDGDPELREAIAATISRGHGTAWDADDVLITNGATGAIFAAMAGYLDPGDIVLLPQPTYSLYADIARLVGAEVIWVDTTSGFRLDPDAIRVAAQRSGGRAKLLVLNNPNNPTGVVYDRDELEAVAQMAEEFGLLVLADEVYDNLVFDEHHFVSTLDIPALRGRLLYCQSGSKTFAMTGWRIGYLAASSDLLPPAARIARVISGGVAWSVQRAALAAYTGSTEPTRLMREEYETRRALIADWLAGAPGLSWTPPQAAFYAFLHYEAPIPARRMQELLREHGVLVRSGTEYGPGGEGHVRLAFATDRATLREGVSRVRAVLEETLAGSLAMSG